VYGDFEWDATKAQANRARHGMRFEERDAAKTLDKLAPQIAEKYAFWCAIVRQSGPFRLRAINSFHDEKLAGKLAQLWSSWDIDAESKRAVG
jgi:uncharacterized DUF497 family protein